MKTFLMAIALCFAIGFGSYASAQSQNSVKKVGVSTSAPFVCPDKIGLDVDLFNRIAENNGWKAEFVYFDTIKDILQAIRDGKVDFGMSGITINSSREMNGIDFSHPYFLDGGIKILTHKDNCSLSLKQRVKIAIPTIKHMLISLFVIVTILAHMIWLREGFRGDNSGFSRNYFKGVFQAYYWAIVTSSTVGYGDFTAKTTIGRFLSIVAIIVGLTWFADFMSDMSATKSLIMSHQASMTLADLNGKKVATISGTTSEDLLARYPGIQTQSFVDVDEACRAVANKGMYALVYDAPVLQYFADNNNDVVLAGDYIVKEQYGIAAKEDDRDLEAINRSLLLFNEDGRYDKIKGAWFKQ